MKAALDSLSDQTPDSTFIVYGSYLESEENANDIDLLVLVEDKEEVETIKEGFRDKDWPRPLDPEFFFRQEFWKWIEHKDFKFSTAFDGPYEIEGRPLDETKLHQLLHEEKPDEDDLKFNFYRSLEGWDKARVLLEDAKHYSRNEMMLGEDFSPELIYENQFNEIESRGVVHTLIKSLGSLSISSGYLSGSKAYSEGESKYTMSDALDSPANEAEEKFQELRALNQDAKDGDYSPDIIEEYLEDLGFLLRNSELNKYFS